MRISDWSSDVCSSDLPHQIQEARVRLAKCFGSRKGHLQLLVSCSRVTNPAALSPPPCSARRSFQAVRARPRFPAPDIRPCSLTGTRPQPEARRSEEHTSELQSLMRISYAVLCLKK